MKKFFKKLFFAMTKGKRPLHREPWDNSGTYKKGIEIKNPALTSTESLTPSMHLKENDVDSNATAIRSKREWTKRKVAIILGYSGTGYQGMQL